MGTALTVHIECDWYAMLTASCKRTPYHPAKTLTDAVTLRSMSWSVQTHSRAAV